MNFEKLFPLQKKLDDEILARHNLQGNSLLSNKALALQCKLGILATETGCYRYWESINVIDRDSLLKSYVKCLHFILSIGSDKGYTDVIPGTRALEYNQTEQLLNLYIDVNDFIVSSSRDHYVTLFEDFLSLSIALGFNDEEIEICYEKFNNRSIAEQLLNSN